MGAACNIVICGRIRRKKPLVDLLLDLCPLYFFYITLYFFYIVLYFLHILLYSHVGFIGTIFGLSICTMLNKNLRELEPIPPHCQK
ncbi:hypothetical protein H4582DRAFT_1954586 [Lactarius indigo]|nr:hypothetical protein H4582DRAFT_1954586 [Lactarius indigo]